jgi:glycosyl transferase family 25
MWPCYVINLDKDSLRLDRVGQELAQAGLSWERVPAVDGRGLSDAELHRHYDAVTAARQARYPLVAPEIGCYLSHRAAWSRIIEGSAPGAVVLEDDMRVQGSLAAVIAALPERPDWDIAKLFSFKPLRFVGPAPELVAGVRIGAPTRVPSTTLGYAITREGARKALAASDRFFRPIDEDHKFFWELGLRIVAVDPSPIAIGVQDTAEGTIGAVRRRANADVARSPLQQVLINLRYRWRYQTGLWRWRIRGGA